MMEFLGSDTSAHIIKVIGVGGGGSNAVNHMYRQGITGVDFIICNTDNQALAMSPIPVKVQLGPELTEGRGAGSVPEVGKEACLESVAEIERILRNNTKMLFITAGMGGGTGTGAAPVIARIARDLGILTVGIVTVPFPFEGKRRFSQAMEGLEQLKKNVDTLIVISNDRLREVYGNLVLREAFSNADNILTTAAKAIAEIITVPGYINVDFADVNTVMRDSGVAIMGVGIAAGPDRARQAIDAALNSPLLEDNNIQGARHILLNITSGTHEVTMDEIMEITDFVEAEAGPGTDVIWGNCYDETLGDQISVTLIATGFQSHGALPDRGKPETEVIDIDEGPSRTSTISKRLVSLDENTEGKRIFKVGSTVEMGVSQRSETPGQFRNAAPIQGSPTTQKPVSSVKLNSPKAISELENEPAYLRRGVSLDDVTHSSEETHSRMTVSGDQEPDLFSSLPFLHDKKDMD